MGVVESPLDKGIQMAVAKLKRVNEDRLEDLAERIAAEINERAEKMTPEDRARADAATKKIADRVRRRTLRG
jgi:vacuolar-type H+-ATPase subunit E/Vma4